MLVVKSRLHKNRNVNFEQKDFQIKIIYHTNIFLTNPVAKVSFLFSLLFHVLKL